MAAIRNLGALVVVDEHRPGKPVVGVNFNRRSVNPAKVTDRTMAYLRALLRVEWLFLQETAVTDAGLRHV